MRALEWVHWHALAGVDKFILMLYFPTVELIEALDHLQRTSGYQIRISHFDYLKGTSILKF